MPRPWPFLDWPNPIAMAHRGGGGEQPENTMVAFEAAVRLGYRYVETDVHTTADGVLVAFHDDRLEPVSDGRGLISDLPYAEVRKARVGGEPIPLLSDILGAWPELRVNIDAKHDACVPALVDVLERSAAHDRVCIGAFCNRRVRFLRRLTSGRVCTWMGPSEIFLLRLASFGLPTRRSFAPCVQVPPRYRGRTLLDRRMLAAAHSRGLTVQVWTINDRHEMETLLDLGVDGICSDRPTLLKEVFDRRGLLV
jgi:glycerophosphoryl diester phosphodiesterase